MRRSLLLAISFTWVVFGSATFADTQYTCIASLECEDGTRVSCVAYGDNAHRPLCDDTFEDGMGRRGVICATNYGVDDSFNIKMCRRGTPAFLENPCPDENCNQ